MSSLLTYTTDLKSYKFGVPPASDRPGGGNSKQPYIKTPIPSQDQQIPGNDLAATDFFLRGGINAARDTADDLIRLGKYFTDFKSINGPLFVAKQNSLSSIAVRTQASGNGTNFGLNEGVYTPLSTLAQAGINFIGGHVEKQGINPIKGVTTYSDVSNIVIGAPNGKGNRLVDLYNTQVPHQGNEFTLDNPVTLYSYQGGPNSILGATKTNINFATDNKGGPMLTGIATKDYQAGLRQNPTNLFKYDIGSMVAVRYGAKQPGLSLEIYDNITADDGISWRQILTNPYTTGTKGTLATKEYIPRNFNTANPTNLFVYPTGDDATSMYMFTTGETVNSNLTSDDGISWRETLTNPYTTGTKGTLATKTYVPRSNRTPNPVDEFIYPTGSTDYSTLLNTPVNSKVDNTNGKTWEYQDFQPSVYKSGSLTSNNRIKEQNTKVLTQEQITAISKETETNKENPGSSIQNFQRRINSLAPNYSFQKVVIDNESGKGRNNYRSPGLSGSIGQVIDGINFQSIYQSETPREELIKGDLIPFVIGAIDEKTSDLKRSFIHFRAYIDSFSDGYTANWDAQKYMGRGESFYKYGGFERKINLGFIVAAQSRQEIEAQYKKLNFLVSNLAPTYSDQGYMGGPLVTLTMGGWCTNLAGFIEGITLDVPEESPWEIGIDNNGEHVGDISQVPHIVKVTGFTFTPIENFRPEKQQLDFDNNGEVTIFGEQKYLTLDNANYTTDLYG